MPGRLPHYNIDPLLHRQLTEILTVSVKKNGANSQAQLQAAQIVALIQDPMSQIEPVDRSQQRTQENQDAAEAAIQRAL